MPIRETNKIPFKCKLRHLTPEEIEEEIRRIPALREDYESMFTDRNSDNEQIRLRETDIPNSKGYPISEPPSEQGILNAWKEIDELKQSAKQELRNKEEGTEQSGEPPVNRR